MAPRGTNHLNQSRSHVNHCSAAWDRVKGTYASVLC